MKKLIIHWGFVLAGLFTCSLLLGAEMTAYKNQPTIPVVCSFVQWEQPKKNDSGLKMKLKCGDKEYHSNDATLILWHLNNPDKEIRGMVDGNGRVTGVEK